jgi:hypothetical protein
LRVPFFVFFAGILWLLLFDFIFDLLCFFFCLAVFVEHKFKPVFLFASLLVDFPFDFVHFLNDCLVFGHFITFIEIIKAKLDVVRFSVYVLQVSLCFFVVPLGSLLNFEGLIGTMDSVFFLVVFSQARAYVQI